MRDRQPHVPPRLCKQAALAHHLVHPRAAALLCVPRSTLGHQRVITFFCKQASSTLPKTSSERKCHLLGGHGSVSSTSALLLHSVDCRAAVGVQVEVLLGAADLGQGEQLAVRVPDGRGTILKGPVLTGITCAALEQERHMGSHPQAGCRGPGRSRPWGGRPWPGRKTARSGAGRARDLTKRACALRCQRTAAACMIAPAGRL